MQRMRRDQNKKKRREGERASELYRTLFRRIKSKARQATSRKKLLEKLTPDEMPASSPPLSVYRFSDRPRAGQGNSLRSKTLASLSAASAILNNVVLPYQTRVTRLLSSGKNETAITTLFRILMGELEPDTGSFKCGCQHDTVLLFRRITRLSLTAATSVCSNGWGSISREDSETYLRGFLGRMLFSGDDVNKPRTRSVGRRAGCGACLPA